MMEESVFPLPAVGGILEKGFIEARLHTDGGPAKTENQALQKKLTGSVATPIYVIIDSKTGTKLRVQEGPATPREFVEFLRVKALD